MAGAWTTAGAQAPEEAAVPVADSTFTNGVAKATAQVAKIAPGVGSLELALGAGKAVSELRNGLAQSQAQGGDLGLIGTVLSAEGCDGGAPLIPSQITDLLPVPVRVDNRKGDAAVTGEILPLETGGVLGVGTMDVRATKEPTASSASATMADASIGPLLQIDGGKASAITRIVDGAAREAIATTEMSINIAGVLDLGGLKWEAIHRTGADPKTAGSFTLGSAPGVPAFATGDQLAPAADALNQLLAPIGLSIQLPQVIHIKEPVDLIRVTPLRIQLKDSQLGNMLLAPVLEATREARQQLFDAIAAQLCQAAGALLVADVVATIAAGAGFVTLDIGGVEATTTDVKFEDPFGSFTAPAPVGTGVLPSSGVALPISPAPSATVPTVTNPTGGAAQNTAVTGPIEEACESVNPADWPPCSHGAALPLGLLGLGLTAGVGVLDWRKQLRKLEVGS